MYTLYVANKNYSSWSLRPWLLMRALGIAFDERLVPFEPQSSFAAFRGFSPTGRVPCLLDDGRPIWESLAIVEYLHERHDGVWPSDEAARAWARCASAEMHAGFSVLRNLCPMNVGVRVRMHPPQPALAADIARIDELWSEGLRRFGGSWLAGDRFTAVDAFFAPVAFRVQTYGITLGEAARGWCERLLAMPSMRAWQTDALAERWREPAHELEAAAAGAIVEDRRRT
jgi:glutathione S-transferase